MPPHFPNLTSGLTIHRALRCRHRAWSSTEPTETASANHGCTRSMGAVGAMRSAADTGVFRRHEGRHRFIHMDHVSCVCRMVSPLLRTSECDLCCWRCDERQKYVDDMASSVLKTLIHSCTCCHTLTVCREVNHLAKPADKMHLRNIFFRARKLLLAGIQLLAVTDGVSTLVCSCCL